ncbi:hypothetical protein KC340_g4178 [Hortaea werneckii]|nr:hypothetical protein KC339_g591 [Hortaea werneckii]KAI7243439.1 hypothetical protein KC365_g2287 [Hortaea werneckii]KAI7330521.1 hypothetical protein KC340_g4178 [Hortaea werneckii]
MAFQTQSNDEPILGTIQYSAAPAAGSHMPTQLTSDQSRLITETADLAKQLASKVQNLEDENQRLFFEMERWKVEAHQLAQEEDRLIHEESEGEESEESEDSEEQVGGKHTDSLNATERQIETESEHVKVGPFIEEEQGLMQDRTIQNSQAQGSGMQAYKAPELLPSLEHTAKPQILYIVVHRRGELCNVKGIFSTVDQANEAAVTVFANEYPNCMYSDVLEKGRSQDPWECTGYEIGEAQRRLGSGGEVRFAVDEENDDVGYVVVLRQELDVQPQRSKDPAPGPLPTWSPPPMTRPYAQNAELSDHEPEGPWWQPKLSTYKAWDMDYNPTNPFYSQEAIAERGGQHEFLGSNHHPSVPPASSSPPPNMQGLAPESLGPFGLPASAFLDLKRGVLKPHLSLAPGLDLQKFGFSQPREAMNHSKPRKPRKPRSDRGIPRTGRSGKRGRKTA